MGIRKINIEIHDENISTVAAVRAVAVVIEQGRISNEGKVYCYATSFSRSLGVFVLAKENKLDERSKRSSSDSFKVVTDKEPHDHKI